MLALPAAAAMGWQSHAVVSMRPARLTHRGIVLAVSEPAEDDDETIGMVRPTIQSTFRDMQEKLAETRHMAQRATWHEHLLGETGKSVWTRTLISLPLWPLADQSSCRYCNRCSHQ